MHFTSLHNCISAACGVSCSDEVCTKGFSINKAKALEGCSSTIGDDRPPQNAFSSATLHVCVDLQAPLA